MLHSGTQVEHLTRTGPRLLQVEEQGSTVSINTVPSVNLIAQRQLLYVSTFHISISLLESI